MPDSSHPLPETTKSCFSTGEFAKLCGVKKQTLIHYDEIGLFKPSVRDDDNNYRYYSIDAFETFFTIKSLQETGMPLSDIKEYISSRNPENFVALLNQRLQSIDGEIERLSRLRAIIAEKIKQTSQEMEFEHVRLEFREREPVLITENQAGTVFPSKAFSRQFMAHTAHCQQAFRIGGVFSTRTVHAQADIQAGDYQVAKAFYTVVPANVVTVDTYLPEGAYAVVYVKDQPSPDAETYSRLLGFIRREGYQAIGDFYEESVLDEHSVKGYQNYIYKVSVRVEKDS